MSQMQDVERRRQSFRLFARYQNLMQVSKELNIPYATLQRWSKEEDWPQRLKDRQTRLTGSLEVLQKAQNNLILEDQVNELKILEHLETMIHELLINEEVRPSSWKDVVDTMKFVFTEKRLILGEPTERSVNTIEVSGLKEEDLDKNIASLRDLLKDTPKGQTKYVSAILKPPVAPVVEGIPDIDDLEKVLDADESKSGGS
jgi:hypothetical protein